MTTIQDVPLTDAITALGTPSAWTPVRRPLIQQLFPRQRPTTWQPALILHHALGGLIHADTSDTTWLVSYPMGPGWGFSLAKFPRRDAYTMLGDFRRGLDAAFGAKARARLDRAVQQARLECVLQDVRGDVSLLRDATMGPVGIRIVGDVTEAQSFKTLSFDTRKAVLACRDVLHMRPEGDTLSTDASISLHLPATLHDKMAFLASMKHQGISVPSS